MNRAVLPLLLPLLLILLLPTASQAVVEAGIGFGVTSFEDDLDGVDTDNGTSLEVNIGSGSTRLMVALQKSSHNQGDYEAWMVGPSWTLGVEGFEPRIYALVSSHEFESIDGWGVTLGGGLAWTLFPSSSFGLDFRISQWEGDNNLDARTGTMQVLFRIGF